MYIVSTCTTYPAGCQPVEFIYGVCICLCSINLSRRNILEDLNFRKNVFTGKSRSFFLIFEGMRLAKGKKVEQLLERN
jgi:hypothetical protein